MFEKLIELLKEDSNGSYLEVVNEDTIRFVLGNEEITLHRSEKERIEEVIDDIMNR